MDFINELGILGFGSRLKRLTDNIMTNAGEVYRKIGIDFEARWFATFYLLHKSDHPLSISDIANALHISHPAIIKITNILLKHELIQSIKDDHDGRKRLLALSEKGHAMIPYLEPIWRSFTLATKELFEEIELDMIAVLEKMENALAETSLLNRIIVDYKQDQYERIEILDFDPVYRDEFRRLNYEWIEKYFAVEPLDELLLNNPEEEILQKGGHILFARLYQTIVGTAALIKLDDVTYMISKMAVAETAQGRQVGHKLLDRLIEHARGLGAEQLVLITNERLQAAMALYRKFGFTLTSPSQAPIDSYQRGSESLVMRLRL